MNESTDIKAAGHIMMELMHGKSEPDGIIGVRDSHRGADVMEFLAAIDLGLAANRLLTVRTSGIRSQVLIAHLLSTHFWHSGTARRNGRPSTSRTS